MTLILLLWIEAWIFILALHEIAGEEDLNSDSIGEYAVCSHCWCKSPRLLCRSLNFRERTVFKCCITCLFEAAYFSFLPSLFQMNYVLDEAVCVDCRATGQARSCTSDAVKLLSFPSSVLWNTNYPLKNLTPPPPSPGENSCGFISEITNALTLGKSPVPYFRSGSKTAWKLRCHTGFICFTLLIADLSNKKFALTISKTNLTFFLSSHKDFMTKGYFWIVSCLCGHSCELNLLLCH